MKTIISLTITFLFFSASLWAVDLTKATLQELVNQRPDLIADIKSGKDEGSSTVSVVKDAQGRMSIWTEERKDINGDLVGKRKDSYTYYLTSEVNTITMERYDSNDKLASKKILKHYRDGTQPDLSVVAIEIPKGL